MPGGALGFLIVVNVLVFILGMFIDFFEIAFIVIPMLAPVAEKLLPACCRPARRSTAIMVWFGVIIAMNLQTSFLTPPFGFALFYLRSVAAKSRLQRPHHRRAHPGRDHGADLQGLDRLHRAAGDHGCTRGSGCRRPWC
jgi:TRAP-type mannitol/chloroaromatic compound transport system permease large subunit